MKKFTKIATIVVSAVLLCTTFMACSNGYSTKTSLTDFLGEDDVKTTSLTTITQSELAGYDYYADSNDRYAFYKYNGSKYNIIVLNGLTNTIVGNILTNAISEFKFVGSSGLFYIESSDPTKVDSKYTIYTKDGSLVKDNAKTFNVDGNIEIDGVEYAFDDDYNLKEVSINSEQYTYSNNDYAVLSASNGFYLFYKNAQIYSYTYRTYNSTKFFVIGDGKYLVQEVQRVSDDAKKYSYQASINYSVMAKYVLNQTIITCKKGKVSEKKVSNPDILYSSIENSITNNTETVQYKDQLINFVEGTTIKDKYLDTSISLITNDSLKVLFNMTDAFYNFDTFNYLGNDLYLTSVDQDPVDSYYVTNGKGEILNSINLANATISTNTMFATNKAIYNYTTDKLADIPAGYVLESSEETIGNNLLYVYENNNLAIPTKTLYMFDGLSFKPLTTTFRSITELYSGLYVVESRMPSETTSTYKYYNSNGVEYNIASNSKIERAYNSPNTSSNTKLYKIINTNTSETVYYMYKSI